MQPDADSPATTDWSSPSERPSNDTTDGPVIAQRYELQSVIGRGVSAVVYSAWDRKVRRRVAIKHLNPHLATDPIGLERFRREIQIARHVGHPGIVGTYDLLVSGGDMYLVLELIEGETLKQILYSRTRLPVAEAMQIVRGILEVLAACHRKNVIHRDLKPQNVMVARESGAIRVLDFGVSRMTSLADLTQSGTTLGSPQYMAPELFAGNTYDPRTDLYALGVMVYELLTGSLPFRSDFVAGLCQKHVSECVPDLRDRVPDAPEWVAAFAQRLMQKHPFARYQCAEEAIADLLSERVLLRQVPSLAKRTCPECGSDTPEESPICLTCGYNTYRTVAAGSRDIWLADLSHSGAARNLLTETLRLDIQPRTSSNGLLLTGATRHLADMLQREGMRRGIALEARRGWGLWRLRRAMALSGTAFIFTWGVVMSLGMVAIMGRGNQQPLHLYAAAVYLVAALGAYRLFLRQPDGPWFDLRIHEVCPGLDYSWLRRIIPYRPASQRANTHRFLAHMVEKYLLLSRGGNHLEADVDEAFLGVLDAIAANTELLADLELRLLGPERARDAEAFIRAERVRLDDDWLDGGTEPGADIEALRRRLGNYDRLDEFACSLTNRLIRLNYTFNSLIGRALVLRDPLINEDADDMKRAADDLSREADAARRAWAELGAWS